MIINCPECGHQTSDKAPTCPNCGVEIAGKIKICTNCRQAYFTSDKECPQCNPKRKKQNTTNRKPWHSAVMIAAVFAALIIATTLYFNKEKTRSKENNAYELAVRSDDPRLMENFLNNFPNATPEHIAAIQKKLQLVNSIQDEWTKARQSKSKSDLQNFLTKYPNTTHKAEIQNLIDSIDWAETEKSNTIDAYQQYLEEHPYSNHAPIARENIKKINTQTVQPEERTAIDNLLTNFFRSINSRSEEALTATLSPNMTSFNNIAAPTQEDVLQWMRRQYKEEGTHILWRLNHQLNIQKREIGDNAYEYTVKLNGTEEIKNNLQNSTNNYNITAIVSPDHKISSIIINKITDENP